VFPKQCADDDEKKGLESIVEKVLAELASRFPQMEDALDRLGTEGRSVDLIVRDVSEGISKGASWEDIQVENGLVPRTASKKEDGE
jgi:hypothetical protein